MNNFFKIVIFLIRLLIIYFLYLIYLNVIPYYIATLIILTYLIDLFLPNFQQNFTFSFNFFILSLSLLHEVFYYFIAVF